jgi:hypothetical protein
MALNLDITADFSAHSPVLGEVVTDRGKRSMAAGWATPVRHVPRRSIAGLLERNLSLSAIVLVKMMARRKSANHADHKTCNCANRRASTAAGCSTDRGATRCTAKAADQGAGSRPRA